MKEVLNNLYVGDQQDFENGTWSTDIWKVVQACKDPYHRKALGYTSIGAPKNDPEYLFATRSNKLILNLVDSKDPNYIPREIINKALQFIDQSISDGFKVFVHCNKGESRSASLALMYMYMFKEMTFEEAEAEFSKVYPKYNPSNGIRIFVRSNWK